MRSNSMQRLAMNRLSTPVAACCIFSLPPNAFRPSLHCVWRSVTTSSFSSSSSSSSSSFPRSSAATVDGGTRGTATLTVREDEKLVPGGKTPAPTPVPSPSFTTNVPPNRSGSVRVEETIAAVLQGETLNKTTRDSTSDEEQNDAFAPFEVRALVLALLPLAVPGTRPVPPKDILYQLPTGLQKQLERFKGGLQGYCFTHFPQDVMMADGPPAGLLRQRTPAGAAESQNSSANSSRTGAAQTQRGMAGIVDTAPPPPPKVASTSLYGGGQGYSTPAATTFQPGRAHTTIELLDAIVEYIPTFFVTTDAVAATIPSEIQALYADTSFNFFLKRFRHYVDVRTTHGHSEVRLKVDFDHAKRGLADEHHGGGMGGRFGAPRINARGAGAANRSGGQSEEGLDRTHASHRAGGGAGGGLARPPRNSEANLIQYLVPRVPKTFTPLAEVLQDLSDVVARHPAFDPRLGVTGLLEKYPEYFQLVEGKLRARPYTSAPFSLDDFDVETSPIPAVFAKLQVVVDQAAEGKNYQEESDRFSATVPTGKLYAQLTAEEKKQVKQQCRSFPRFLRLHGKAIVVSTDNMKVYKFKPAYEPCAETILDRRLAMNAISPDDPILKIPAEMDEKVNADWAVKELYDSLPLTQCAELGDVLSLVPPAVCDALPKQLPLIVTEVLDQYPDYFMTWRDPDDENTIIVQRAKIEIPVYTAQDIVRLVFPLIPQGGMELSALRRRVPIPLQRYFYRHGMRKTLEALPQHFRIAGERIIRLA